MSLAPWQKTMRSAVVGLFCLFLTLLLVSGAHSIKNEIDDANLSTMGGLGPGPNCTGTQCTLYVTTNTSKCVPNFPCISSLLEAVLLPLTNQRVVLLDEVVELNELVYVNSAWNYTIESSVGSVLKMSANSSSALGPFLFIFGSIDFTLKNIGIEKSRVRESPIVIGQSRGRVEGLNCHLNLLEADRRDAPMYMSACLFSRNSIIQISKGTFRTNRIHMVHNGAPGFGAALSSVGGKLFIEDSYFRDQIIVSDQGCGPAVYTSDATLIISNGTFIGNRLVAKTHGVGGAVFSRSGDLDISASSFFNNSIRLQAYFAAGTGGAIRHVARPVYPNFINYYLSITSSVFSGNFIRGIGSLEGGALSVSTRSVILYNLNVTDNNLHTTKNSGQLASRSALSVRGGAFRITSYDIEILNCGFYGNIASAPTGYTPGWALGGALDITAEDDGINSITQSDSTVTIRKCRFMENVALGGNSSEENTGGNAFGGAVKISAFESKLTIDSNYFDANIANGGDGPTVGGAAEGGALHIVHVTRRQYWPMSENETDSDEKNRFYDSIHDDMEHDLDGEEQGSQQSTNSSSKTTLLSSLTSSTSPSDSSTSPSVGTEAFRVILTHNTFYFNFAIGAEGSMTGGDATGAALYFEGLNISIYGGEFLGNSAIGGNTTVTTAAMGGNTGGYARGGGVFIHRHTRQVSIQSTMFELNSAEGGIGSLEPNPYIPSVYGRGGMAFGGAIAAWTALSLAEQHFTVRFCQFFDNDAIGGHAYLNAGQGMGGAIWGSRVNLDNTRFFANFAANGGAIYTLDLKADQNTFAYNDAKATTQEPALGGAIFAFTALISNSSFLGNVAKTQFAHGDALGGAIHSEESLRVESCDFRFNKALTRYTQALGGAVAGYAHTELFNCSFIENGALSASELGTGCGGSIYLDLTGFNSSVESLTIMSSNASYGGGMYIRGIGARYMHWKDVTVVGNLAFIAGGGVAFLPNRWDGGIIKSLCSTCKVHGNNAWYYGIDLIATYMSIVGTTSAVVNPGLPFEANFSILDYAENTVKDIGVVMVLSAPSETMFQSGAAQNTKYLDPFDGTIEWNDMTIWGPPGERFSLNFTLDHYMADFGANHVWIRLQVEYVLEGCPPGFRMENTSSYPACQLCLAGLYGFHSDCLPCPGDASCVLQEELIDPSVYTLLPGFAPSPRINPVAVLKCPFSYGGDKNGQPLSSCLPSVCITNCGQDRHLDSNATSTCPAPLANCTTDCADHACAQGHTGFLCTQCVCNNYPEECYYPADEQCHKCHYNLKPTLIVFGIAILCFILLKGNLLLIVMGVLSIVAIFLLGFNLISPLIPGMFGTAFIIFAEAKRGSSSGLVKSFVFFVQTVSVYITPDVFPPQLSKLVQLRSLTQFRVTGLECLNSSLFGDPFKRFIFSMVFPLTLLLLVVILYWLCELLRSIRIFRMLQDFDPFMHIPFCRSRLMALRRPEYSLLQRSESEVALVGDSYLSDSVGVGGSAVPSLMADTTDSGDSPLGTSLFGGDDNASHAGSSSDKKERYLKRMNAELGRVSLFLIFAAHFELCTRVLEVFAPCIHVPSEGFWYSSTMPWLVCRDPSKQIGYFSANTVHGKMAIAGLLFGALYVLGVPAAFASLLYWRRVEIKAGDLATAQWLGLLYNSYRPSLHYFELAWILRRICIAAAISMIPFTFVSRFLIPIVILFLSLLAQRRYKPFLSKQDNNMEVISLLTIVFSIAANAIISSRPTASDVVVWKWLNFLIVSLTLLAFLYKLFKPFFKFLRSPRD